MVQAVPSTDIANHTCTQQLELMDPTSLGGSSLRDILTRLDIFTSERQPETALPRVLKSGGLGQFQVDWRSGRSWWLAQASQSDSS